MRRPRPRRRPDGGQQDRARKEKQQQPRRRRRKRLAAWQHQCLERATREAVHVGELGVFQRPRRRAGQFQCLLASRDRARPRHIDSGGSPGAHDRVGEDQATQPDGDGHRRGAGVARAIDEDQLLTRDARIARQRQRGRMRQGNRPRQQLDADPLKVDEDVGREDPPRQRRKRCRRQAQHRHHGGTSVRISARERGHFATFRVGATRQCTAAGDNEYVLLGPWFCGMRTGPSPLG